MNKLFNEEQLTAIEYGKGSLMIIAGPGSGKTTVITERIKYLINGLGVLSSSILVVTFSRASAKEMRDRFLSMGVATGDEVTFGTFHSVFYSVLIKAYGKLARNYIFDDDSEDKIRFDEMLVLTNELFKERKDILEAVRNKYQWILIDEFQDIDGLQYEIIKQIAPKGSNLTIVGDDDQSIYGFRGADSKIMLGFEKDYPNTKRVILSTNYRSYSEITKAATRLIGHNKVRFAKNINAWKSTGGRTMVYCFFDMRQEYDYIVKKIVSSISSGRSIKEIAILYRYNVQPWQLKFLLDENGVGDVNLLTFHKSKGLEFEEVYIIDANRMVVPSRRAKNSMDIEGERRAFYVAMTRAKNELNICYSKDYKQHKTEASIFVDELYS